MARGKSGLLDKVLSGGKVLGIAALPGSIFYCVFDGLFNGGNSGGEWKGIYYMGLALYVVSMGVSRLREDSGERN